MRFIPALALLLSFDAQARVPFLPGRAPAPSEPAAVSYYGGPVISHVKTMIVFWGNGVDLEKQAKLEAFYRALVNSTYMDQLAEYGTRIRAVDGREGTNQVIGRGTVMGVAMIAPVNTSRSLTQADVEQELEAQIASGGLPKPDADTYYALHFPDGYSISISFGGSCSSWLADHEVYQSKKFGPVYYAMFPCQTGWSTDTFAISHELAEAVVDPMSPLANAPNAFPAGWIRADGQEIADLCTGYQGTLTSGAESYAVNELWLNSESRCHTGDFTGP